MAAAPYRPAASQNDARVSKAASVDGLNGLGARESIESVVLPATSPGPISSMPVLDGSFRPRL